MWVQTSSSGFISRGRAQFSSTTKGGTPLAKLDRLARRVSASCGFSSGLRSYWSSFTGQVHEGEVHALSLMPAFRPSLLLDVHGSPPYRELAYSPGRDHSGERTAQLFVRCDVPQKWRSH